MKKLSALFLTMLLAALPLSAEALIIKNCTDEAHTVQVEFAGGPEEFTIPPSGRKQVGGAPLHLRMGKQFRPFVLYNDEWCIWGKDRINLQRRPSSHQRS